MPVDITFLKGHAPLIDEIKSHPRAPRSCPVTLARIDKHTYRCTIADTAFLFRNTPHRGPGIALRLTPSNRETPPADLQEVPGHPGLVERAHFPACTSVHIERMDHDHYWCRIDGHHLTLRRAPRPPGTIELLCE